MRTSRFLASTLVLALASCGGSDDDALFTPGGAGGSGAAGSNAAGTSAGKAGASTTGGSSGSTSTGGSSGSTTTGGSSGSTSTGGAGGSATTGGSSGSTSTGGAGGSATTGGSSGSTSTGGKAGSGGTAGKAGAAGTGTAGTGTAGKAGAAGTGTAGTGTAGTGTAGTGTAGTTTAGAGGSVPAPTCSDALKNQDESDVDCGGSTCKPCVDGQMCLKFSDCVGGICNAGICETTPTCTDGLANGNETDVDCGGPTTCDRCADGKSCLVAGDCKGGACKGATCATPLVFALGNPQNVTGNLLAEPWFADIGDIDNDGQPDVIVADNTANRITFLKNAGGTLAAMGSTATCGAPFQALLRKMNTDANVDVVIACSAGSTQLLAGNGAGSFGGAINFTHPTVWANVVDELGGQQGNDLVTISNVQGGQNYFVRFGNGVTFAPPLFGMAPQAPSHGIAVDLTGDGIRDLVITGQQVDGNGNQVYLSKNNGNTTFTALASLTVPAGPRSVATGDLNGDGNADLVVASQTADALTVFLGKGDGSFSAPIGLAGGDGARWAVAVDLDADGDVDLASVSVNDDLLHVFLNDGNAGFTALPVISLAPAAEPRAITAGDLNGDGLPDLVIPYSNSATFNGGVLVFLNGSK